jgi:hypothetical protein
MKKLGDEEDGTQGRWNSGEIGAEGIERGGVWTGQKIYTRERAPQTDQTPDRSDPRQIRPQTDQTPARSDPSQIRPQTDQALVEDRNRENSGHSKNEVRRNEVREDRNKRKRGLRMKTKA